MSIQEGQLVRIDGSDEYWEVIEVNKEEIWVRDYQMGIIEIQVSESEILEVMEEE